MVFCYILEFILSKKKIIEINMCSKNLNYGVLRFKKINYLFMMRLWHYGRHFFLIWHPPFIYEDAFSDVSTILFYLCQWRLYGFRIECFDEE